MSDKKNAQKSDAEKPADDAKGDAPAEPEKKSLKDKIMGQMKYIIIGLVALVVIGGGVGVYLSGFFMIEKPHETLVMLPGEPVYYELPRFTVNLKPTAQRQRPFIRLTLQAELQGESAKTAFIEREIKIMDAIQSHLRTITFEDLNHTHGTERLREDIVIITNRIIQPEIVITILYKDIFMR